MSVRETSAWLRLYPSAWRERYGEELQELVLATSGDGPIPWRTRLDLIRAGARERVRAVGLAGGDTPAAEQARAGALLVLCAWALFIVGGGVIQKFSEQWQHGTPPPDRAFPAGAFGTVAIVALVTGLLVLIGIACTLPHVLAFLRGRWREIRRPAMRALVLSAVVLAGTATLAGWAHHLSTAQRNGHDVAYGVGFGAWALLGLACLAAWTTLAVTIARRIELSHDVLKLEVWLAVCVSVAMLTMTIATAVWWGALAHDAPWVLHGYANGTPASPLALQPLFAGALMALATVLAIAGAARALQALPRLAADP